MNPTLHLFCDTNLFVQCRPLDELTWDDWSNFDTVQIIVSRPVQKEIDHQKNRGSDRVGKRARSASSIFRTAIANDGHLVRPSSPRVVLLVRPDLRRSSTIVDQLDYEDPDDCLVGIAFEFKQLNPHEDVRILTHDTGPFATGKMIGLDVILIPDEWLLAPETTVAEKQIKSLEAEITRLKSGEPTVRLGFRSSDECHVDRLELEAVRYVPLNPSQVDDLMERVQKHFPMATDFGPKDAIERAAINVFGRVSKETFQPATADSIAKYQEAAYPKWLAHCEKAFRNMHTLLQNCEKRPTFAFHAENIGIRPGKDVLVTVSAEGNFKLAMPKLHPVKRREEIVLQSPPLPPQGEWEKDPLTKLISQAMSPLGDRSLPLNPSQPIMRLPDPNAFRYKGDKPSTPCTQVQWTCEQWRHGLAAVAFDGELSFDSNSDAIEGALICRVHAANLSSSKFLRVPIRIYFRRALSIDAGDSLVHGLITKNSPAVAA